VTPGTDGLLHISEVAHHRVERIEDELEEGQEIMVKVILIDPMGRVKLSRRELLVDEGGLSGGDSRPDDDDDGGERRPTRRDDRRPGGPPRSDGGRPPRDRGGRLGGARPGSGRDRRPGGGDRGRRPPRGGRPGSDS
jgi:polyribonucleotide nucleotidyltransferase